MNLLREIVILVLRLFFGFYFFVFGRPRIPPTLKKLLTKYQSGGFSEFFSYIRVWDAPFEVVEKVTPKEGLIIDLGCGEGILTNFLGLSSKRRKIIGVEIDKERILLADKKISNVSFSYGDVTKFRLPKSNVIILSHLLHHLSSYKDQEELLKRCVSALTGMGRLVIVEVDTRPPLKYLTSLLTDYFLVPWLFDRKIYERTYFRRRNEWLLLFDKLGLKSRTIIAHKGKPFSHIVFVCQKS
ncbi:MAG: hypothetical protein UU32_C0001G0008 [Candidatus Woesebacteria bacterium GW2011_GWB1_41_10]|uniref:Methyltransferase domain-containing protein n=1 Tax=Candidatus Woesebacteria bacterium GW2011_GWB1_41_10 TaxID=1618577 RepID=A0A0G0XKI9_9BACT|nr:MAG: hypothetical protein UU32_C0001G0008 [Candidatus Woesebacteria bacterium GW2011_GWB1_41_10]